MVKWVILISLKIVNWKHMTTKKDLSEYTFDISDRITFVIRAKSIIESVSWVCVLIFQLGKLKLLMKTYDFDN